MKVLVACEFSGVVRDAFKRQGHDAWSCDLLESEEDGQHLQGDIRQFLDQAWDIMIAHPPCTYLANSGVQWLHHDTSRWEKLDEAATFFNTLLQATIPKICIENPIPHIHAQKRIVERDLLSDTRPCKYSQIIQPYMFGHRESKAICFWLKGLHPLVPTTDLKDETMALPSNARQRLFYLPPSQDRWKLRSTTYQGVADAMADQWGTP